MMKFKNWLWTAGLLVTIIAFTSCATTHPNEKLLIGTWQPQKVETWIPPEKAEQMKAQQDQQKTRPASQKTEGTKTDQKTGQATGQQRNSIDKLIGLEQRTTLRIGPDHTAVKAYPGKTLKATWKLKGNGTLILAKNIETKEKYKIDLVEISPTHCVTIQHADGGELKITYVKEQ